MPQAHSIVSHGHGETAMSYARSTIGILAMLALGAFPIIAQQAFRSITSAVLSESTG
jgi:hypothetical protein